MKSLIYLKSYLLVTLVLFFFLTAFKLNTQLVKPQIFITKQNETWNLNDQMAQQFNLGFKRLESSLLWILTILESDQDHYKKKDLNSWMFRRFNTISNLEPFFYENYAFGGVYLSIVKDDLPGASLIYNKGLKYFSNDYTLLKDAGFHFYFEVEDYKRAYEIYSKLKNHPKASVLVISALARLEESLGNSEAAFTLLLNKYEQVKDKNIFLAERIHNQLYSLKAELDLNCLNSKTRNKCSMTDFDNILYVIDNNIYKASKSWKPFKITRKKNSSH